MEDHGDKAWERQAETWARRVRAGEDYYRDAFNRPAFLDFLPDLSGRAGLDLGCGEGGMTRDLAVRGARMTGLDRAEAMHHRSLALNDAVGRDDATADDYRDLDLSGAQTVQGGSIEIDTSDGVRVDGARVVQTDIAASNGAIHVIDTVILPKS